MHFGFAPMHRARNTARIASSAISSVQAIGVEHIRVQQDYQHSQDNLRELMLRHRTECQKHIETASHLRKANERIRELEVWHMRLILNANGLLSPPAFVSCSILQANACVGSGGKVAG